MLKQQMVHSEKQFDVHVLRPEWKFNNIQYAVIIINPLDVMREQRMYRVTLNRFGRFHHFCVRNVEI